MSLVSKRPLNLACRIIVLCGLLVASLCCVAVSAESVEQLQAQVVHIKSAQKVLQQNILSQQSRSVKHEQELTEVKAGLSLLEKELEAVFQQVKDAPTELSQRNATKLSITYNRELDKASRLTKRVQGHRNKLSQLEKALAANQTQQYQLQKLILQEKDRAKTAREKAAAESFASQRPSIQKGAVAEPAVTKASKPESIALWPYLNRGSDADKAFAKDALKTAKEAGGTPIFRRVQIRGKKTFGKKTMEFLGGDLYSYSDKVVSGQQSFQVFDNVFWAQIPKEDDGRVYRFIFDVSSLSSPELRIFRESALSP